MKPAALIAALLLSAAPTLAQTRIATVRDPARLVAMGERMERNGDPLAATVFYERALDLAPSNVGALRAAGENALKRGDAAAAMAHFSALANAEPRNAQALIGLGSALVLNHKPQDALATLQRATDLGGDKGQIAAQRGLAYDLAGEARNAQLAFAEALSVNPQDSSATQRMALSLALSGDNGAAMTLLQRFGPEPGSAEVRRTLALVHALGGRMDDAAQICASLMPMDEARRMQSFYAQLPRLGPRDRALAVHFGTLPGAAPGRPIPLSSAVQLAKAVAPAAASEPGTIGPAEAVITPEAATPGMAPVAPEVLRARPRLWVQLVSVTDAGKLPDEWRRLRGAAGEAVEGQLAYVQRAGPANRLLIGPFASDAAVRATLARLKARRVPAIPNRTPAGADIAPLS